MKKKTSKKKVIGILLCIMMVFSYSVGFNDFLINAEENLVIDSNDQGDEDSVMSPDSDEDTTLSDEEYDDTDAAEDETSEHLHQRSPIISEGGKAAASVMMALSDEVDGEEKDGTVEIGGLIITGKGEAWKSAVTSGTDATWGSYIQIATDAPLTISGTSTTHNIWIAENTTANITLNGVTISESAYRDSPINLLDGSSCNITLIGTNELTVAQSVYAAALHVGVNSTLTIDGSGTLNATGGLYSAAIGSGYSEIAGKMYINGGTITARAADNGSGVASGGAGIGAGCMGGSTYIEINGGKILAYGAYHAAGVGAGYGNTSYNESLKQHGAVTGASSSKYYRTCGDITINDGYIESHGGTHGGAFGAACVTTANGCTIKVNGGTLLARPVASMYAFDGTGGQVYIMGGSVDASIGLGFRMGTNQNYAYDANNGAVFMTTINLSAEGIKDDVIDTATWKVTIGGVEYDYGSPYSFDNGNLYLWVPATASGKTISVTCAYWDSEGNYCTLDPLYIEDAKNDGSAILKRYIDFELPDTYITELTKDYDGRAFARYDLETKPIKTPDGKELSSNDDIEIFVQRYDEIGGVPIEEEHSTGGGNVMPSDAGIYKFTMVSKQYANMEGFKESYWGHRATGWAVINKIPSKVAAEYAIKVAETEDGKLVITDIQVADTVQPGDDKSSDYALPDGKLQFYINGVKVGPEIDLKEWQDKKSENKTITIYDAYEIGGEGNIRVPELETGEFKVTAVYSGGTNYLPSESEAELVPWNVIKPEDGVDPEPTPPSMDTIVNTFPFINPPVPTIGNLPEGEGDPDPNEPVDGNQLKVEKIERIDQESGDPETWPVHGFFTDKINQKVKKDEVVTMDQLVDLINDRYVFTTKKGTPLLKNGKLIEAAAENIQIFDSEGNDITEKVIANGIDLSEAAKYTISVTVEDASGNKSTIDIAYNVTKPILINSDLNKDTNDDGIPDINIDKDGDGIPETNIDTDGDDKPDINIDTNDDGKPDINIDTNDDGKPDINIDTNDDGKPDINIDTNDDGKPDVNIDTDGDGKPDINKDTDGDGKPDVDIDTDGDGKPDINKDTDGDGKPDLDIDTNGDGKPDVNVDTNGDGKPDINIDTNGDGKPDVDIDTDGDGIPDINIDTNGDGKPDINIDTNGDGKPDVNIDTDGDGKPDINIDTDGDGIPDLNVDTDGDGIADVNIDTDGDGKPDKNIKKPNEIDKIINGDKYDSKGAGKNDDKTDELPWWIPRTGDTANMLTWIAVLGAAILVLSAVFGLRKRNNTK